MAVQTNDILRVATRLTDVNGEAVVNVWHVRLDGGGPQDEEDVMDELEAYMETIYTNLIGVLHSGSNYLDINYFNVTTLNPMGSRPWPTLTNNSGSGDPLPSQVSAMIRGTTGKSRNWARKFFGPFAEPNNTDNGYISSGAQSALIAAGVDWLVGRINGGMTFVPVVWYSKNQTWRQITEAVVRGTWSTIRRRRHGRGI
jgi:hypothetical protein